MVEEKVETGVKAKRAEERKIEPKVKETAEMKKEAEVGKTSEGEKKEEGVREEEKGEEMKEKTEAIIKREKKEKEKVEEKEKAEEVKEVKPKETKVFVIPLRKAFRKSKDKRAKYAIRLIREFLARHLKVEEEKIKLGQKLNEAIWERGREKPPRRVKVIASVFEDHVLCELFSKK